MHQFQDLPAELRAAIWDYASQNQKPGDNENAYRCITVHNFNAATDSIAVRMSRSYPSLFAVSQKARSEAAKLNGCEWIPIHANHEGSSPEHSTTFSICINFGRDLLELPEDMLDPAQQTVVQRAVNTNEHYNLIVLSWILHDTSIRRIQRIAIATRPPTDALRSVDHAWWRGEGLEMSQLGHLQTVHISASKCAYANWVKLSVEDHLDFHWIDNGWRF